MRILIALTYYRPHYSGLTIYTERLARALVDLGHQVTVLTSQFEKELPREEIVDGVKVIRLPVALHISKGVIMPSMPFVAWREIRKADIVNIHLPQLDAAPIALNARILGKPVLLTYHCDLLLPSGFINRLANIASDVANHIASSSAAKIVTNTMDYA
ncbi:MAG: glycosyltransferase, partial [Chloroflexi bacterium]|nr:glycosyltransferase [Chloroflexota bacterium]